MIPSQILQCAQPELQPYAVPLFGQLGRLAKEAKTFRLPFQVDRDRILHTQAFRRLQYKTQVFAFGHGDHFRTRLTHTLEVVQISRDLARTLGLNEDLAECIALAHDLGHTPFGHAGEEAMNACMQQHGLHFEHNEQSLRIVTILERNSHNYGGLNLNTEVIEGLMKHREINDSSAPGYLRSLSLEAQVVNLADEIAYTVHDIDDGLRANLLTIDDVKATQLGKKIFDRVDSNTQEARGMFVDTLLGDLFEQIPRVLLQHSVKTLSDVYACKHSLIFFSHAIKKQLEEMRDLLWKNVYGSQSVQAQAEYGKKIVSDLFTFFMTNPSERIQALIHQTGSSLPLAVKDFIAGMTDAYAGEMWTEVMTK